MNETATALDKSVATFPVSGCSKRVDVPELHAQQTATGVEHDPLANLRKVEASRPGFHYRGTENLDVLVYGRRESR
jgi:hypothetical protein